MQQHDQRPAAPLQVCEPQPVGRDPAFPQQTRHQPIIGRRPCPAPTAPPDAQPGTLSARRADHAGSRRQARGLRPVTAHAASNSYHGPPVSPARRTHSTTGGNRPRPGPVRTHSGTRAGDHSLPAPGLSAFSRTVSARHYRPDLGIQRKFIPGPPFSCGTPAGRRERVTPRVILNRHALLVVAIVRRSAIYGAAAWLCTWISVEDGLRDRLSHHAGLPCSRRAA